MIAHYTDHALQRANQRGIQSELIDAILEYADVEVPVGSGCTSLRISKRALKNEDVRRRLGPLVDRAAKTAVLWRSDDNAVVTVMKDLGSAAARRYRKLH